MKLTDVLANVLRKENVKNVFGLQGGAVVHIFDSLEKKNIKVTYTHHEESAGLAAVANAKVNKNIGCAVVTTGPASTNVITGLLASWQDSVPCIFISGQARSNHTSYGKKVRQVGTQEVNICDIVKPITKYAKFINKKDNFQVELIKAIQIAKSGRPGPVWIDLPLEIQWSEIKYRKNIKNFNKPSILLNNRDKKNFIHYFNQSKKPIFILGYGLRSDGVKIQYLKKFIEKNNIPFASTWNAADIFPTDHRLNMGIIGMSGQRGANKSIFQSDLIVCLGSHLSIPHTTTLYEDYAPEAKKIIVNIDKNQLENLNVKFDLKIYSDLEFFIYFLNKLNNKKSFFWKNLDTLKSMNWYNPIKNNFPNSDVIINSFTRKFNKKKCLIVDGGGTALYSGFQSSVIKKGDRIICSSSISAMGTGLAETIGVWDSKKFKDLVCVIGDGSFLMNIQDLQTIKQKKINVKILLVNNNGYLAIRNTQKEFLSGRFFGTHPKWNLEMPNFKNIIQAFGLKYTKISKLNDIDNKINKLISSKGPIVCEVFTDENQSPLFKQGYKKISHNLFEPQSLSEMYPFVDKPLSNTNN
jgi:acetolactate synthase-1/2/3 large subunit